MKTNKQKIKDFKNAKIGDILMYKYKEYCWSGIIVEITFKDVSFIIYYANYNLNKQRLFTWNKNRGNPYLAILRI